MSIQAKYITALIALIHSHTTGSESSDTASSAASGASLPRLSHSALAHYRNTLAYIKSRRVSPETQDRFALIEIIENN